MDSYNAASVYGLPPCSAAANAAVNAAGNAAAGAQKSSMMMPSMMPSTTPQVTTPMTPAMMPATAPMASPSIDEIASYNYMNPLQQQQQKQQLQQIGSRSYSGMPVPSAPSSGVMAAMPPSVVQPMAMTQDGLQYLNGFLRTQIGRAVKVDFLIGTNTLLDKTGTLLGVGINYILINEADSDDVVACDFYNIKFIKFYY